MVGVVTAAVAVTGMVVSDTVAGIAGRRAAPDRWERWEARLAAQE